MWIKKKTLDLRIARRPFTRSLDDIRAFEILSPKILLAKVQGMFFLRFS
jgi:hypothetical protein